MQIDLYDAEMNRVTYTYQKATCYIIDVCPIPSATLCLLALFILHPKIWKIACFNNQFNQINNYFTADFLSLTDIQIYL